jgi:TonB-dependent receptor
MKSFYSTRFKIPLICFFTLISTGVILAQNGKLSGKVSDQETGDYLPGATVVLQGSAIGAAVNVDGSYLIPKVPAGSQTFVVSSVGYKRTEFTINIPAGGAVIKDVQLASSAQELNELVVTGLRKSQIDAINRKRMAMSTKEVLTTNDIGRLPDINVAEAAQRVSGVSIETDNGEGRFISIRGIRPALNNVTMNNSNIGSTSSGRETPLDLLPVEMISSIEVTKAITPDMEGTGIGGAININTISAFDKSEPQFFIASADGLIQNQQADYGDDKLPFRLAATAGKRFGENEKFGAVVSANFFRRDFSVSILDPDRWVVLSGTDPSGNPVSYLGPNEIELQIEDNERDRYGASADLEYRFTPENNIYFRSLYTRTEERDLNSEFELTVAGLRNQELTNQTPTSGRFSKGSGELDLSSGDVTEDLYSFTLGTENRFGALSAELYGTYSRANQTGFSIDGTFENPRDTEGLLASTYDLEPFFFDITAIDQETARDPSLYNLRNLNFRRDNTVQENMYEATLDLKYDLNLGGQIPAYIKMGGRYRTRDKTVDRQRDEYNDDGQDPLTGDNTEKVSNPYTLAQFAIDPFPPVQGGAEPNVHGDALKFREFFDDPANINDTTRLRFRPYDTAEEIYDEDIIYREGVTAGYIMGVVDFNFLTVVAGLRVEHTTTESEPWTLVNDDESIPVQDRFDQLFFENSYTNWMPSVNLKVSPIQNLIARLSWSNTIGRPDYDEVSGTSELEIIPETEGGGTVGFYQGANAGLLPYESENWDLSVEYYFPTGGIISAGLFRKNIDNYIFNEVISERNTVFQGITFEEISFSQRLNLETATVQGMEFSFDQSFTSLPGFLSGFGITANATFIDSELEYPGREGDELPLLRQQIGRAHV